MNTKCFECGKVMKEKSIRHHYVECGLPNVYLDGVSEFTCPECNTSFVDIPGPEQLHIVLAMAIANSPEKLTGPEIKFLRKEVCMTGKSFAQFIGVDPVTLSRWENDKGDANKEDSNDHLIRMAFKIMMGNRLQTYIAWIESMIEKASVISFNRKRVDVNTDFMRFVSLPSATAKETNCPAQI